MATEAGARIIHVIGKHEHGNREMLVTDAGEMYDLPVEAEATYDEVTTRFPYELPA